MNKYQIIDKEIACSSLMNLSSTPIAVLSHLGLKTYAGISGDDPSGTRNIGQEFQLLISIYHESKLHCIANLGLIGPGQREFICVDEVLTELNCKYLMPSLVVIHRIPIQYFKLGRLSCDNEAAVPDQYYMYRIVVQYENDKGGMASVTYETPPRMNISNNGKASFLSFSNMIFRQNLSDNYLIFINYSMNFKYDKSCRLHINLYDEKGVAFKSFQNLIEPFSSSVINITKFICNIDESQGFSYVAASKDATLLPLSLILNSGNGGISLEHTHPPQEYLYSDWNVSNDIKSRAVEYYSKSYAV